MHVAEFKRGKEETYARSDHPFVVRAQTLELIPPIPNSDDYQDHYMISLDLKVLIERVGLVKWSQDVRATRATTSCQESSNLRVKESAIHIVASSMR